MAEAKEFIGLDGRQVIEQAIREAEESTSGEIRVHIEARLEEEEVKDRAAHLFAALKMHKTKMRNGVLFYLAYEDHQFAILGDKGINQKVPDDFWEHIKDEMQAEFKQSRFAAGLAKGVEMAGEALKQYFPLKKDDINELPDEVSFRK
ncbi:MAG: TPM domain-containing protein [Bacteroidia bacterium]